MLKTCITDHFASISIGFRWISYRTQPQMIVSHGKKAKEMERKLAKNTKKTEHSSYKTLNRDLNHASLMVLKCHQSSSRLEPGINILNYQFQSLQQQVPTTSLQQLSGRRSTRLCAAVFDTTITDHFASCLVHFGYDFTNVRSSIDNALLPVDQRSQD